MKPIFAFAGLILVLSSCTARPPQPGATPMPAPNPAGTGSLTQAEAATLGSLERVDSYPLYTMHYAGSYSRGPGQAASDPRLAGSGLAGQAGCRADWGCSLFAALGNENSRLVGRNFDWEFSPALLLFTAPPDGYASVSMVDIAYLGFDGLHSQDLPGLSPDARRPLLEAPFWPFDGMNERGLAISMAAVPAQRMPNDPTKQTIDELQAMREVLDHAATVDEAIKMLDSYNIDMGSVPIHYLIASAAGDSAVVEFHEGRMVVFRNASAWQTATNFLIASTDGHPEGQCWRNDLLSQRLEALQGRISAPDAMRLLGDVSQENTQWSVVYHLTSGDIDVVMGRGYTGAAHTFHLEQPAR